VKSPIPVTYIVFLSTRVSERGPCASAIQAASPVDVFQYAVAGTYCPEVSRVPPVASPPNMKSLPIHAVATRFRGIPGGFGAQSRTFESLTTPLGDLGPEERE